MLLDYELKEGAKALERKKRKRRKKMIEGPWLGSKKWCLNHWRL